jgi:hypothetical protein
MECQLHPQNIARSSSPLCATVRNVDIYKGVFVIWLGTIELSKINLRVQEKFLDITMVSNIAALAEVKNEIPPILLLF